MTIEKGVKLVIDGLNKEFPETRKLKDDFKNTPQRVAETLRNVFKGYTIPEDRLKNLLKPIYNTKFKGMVVEKNIVSYSMCPHHLLPIRYSFAIGYIPQGNRVVGLSKLARLCGYYSRRPDLQENMTVYIVNALEKYLKPKGCAVISIGKHDCISIGGGETNAPEFMKLNSTTDDKIYNMTPELRGVFREKRTREEFYHQIQDWLNQKGDI